MQRRAERESNVDWHISFGIKRLKMQTAALHRLARARDFHSENSINARVANGDIDSRHAAQLHWMCFRTRCGVNSQSARTRARSSYCCG